jgi:hypothetical protein
LRAQSARKEITHSGGAQKKQKKSLKLKSFAGGAEKTHCTVNQNNSCNFFVFVLKSNLLF